MKNILVLSLVVACMACGADEKSSSTSITYKVDNAMAEEISRQLVDNTPADSMNVRVIVDDSTTFSSYETKKKLTVFTTAILHKDTITIEGMVGDKAAFGFTLSVFKDGVEVKQVVRSAQPIYKFNADDKEVRQVLAVPCQRAEVTLAKAPRFKGGEILSGKVQLSSVEYYEKIGNKQRKYRLQMTCYFRTEPVIEDK